MIPHLSSPGGPGQESLAPRDAIHGGKDPLTRSEMQACLEPLHTCLLRMESTLMRLSSLSLPSAETTGERLLQLAGDGPCAPMQDQIPPEGPVNLSSAEEMDSAADQSESQRSPRLPTSEPDKPCAPLQHQSPPEGPVNLLSAEEMNSAADQSESQRSPSLPSLEEGLHTDGDDQRRRSETSLMSHTMSGKHKDRFRRAWSTNFSEHTEKTKIGQLANQLFLQRALKRMGRRASVDYSYFDLLVMKVLALANWWGELQEPERKGPLSRLVNSSFFETFCMTVIMANSFLLALVADWEIQHVGMSQPETMVQLERGFLIFFALELLLRLIAHRCYFFVNSDMHWNIFDFALVIISLIDVVLENVMQRHLSGNSNALFMRMLRFLKLARILRSLRSIRFFKSLGVLLESFVRSLMSLFWGWVLLAFVLYIFALVFLQALVSHLEVGEDLDPDTRRYIMSNFGSLGAMMMSLYMSVTGGTDWGPYYEIMYSVGRVVGFGYIFFTFIFIFALFNILTGAIVEKALATAKPARAEIILRQRIAQAEERQEFAEVFKLVDRDHSSTISLKEVNDRLRDPVILSYMKSHGVEMTDIELFFASVGDPCEDSETSIEQKEVTLQQFIDACMSMQGQATALDMHTQLFETRKIQHELRKLRESMLHIMQQNHEQRSKYSTPKPPTGWPPSKKPKNTLQL